MINPYNKERPFPEIFAGIQVGSEKEIVGNPFSGEITMLEPDAVAVYDVVKGAELVEDYARVREGLDWFRKYFPQEYMLLLD